MGKEDNNSGLLDDLLDGEIDSDEEGKVDINDLQGKIEELERQNKGLLSAKQAEVSKRQAVANRLEQLEGAVSNILSKRQKEGMESLTESQVSEVRTKGLPVVYDDDGNAFVDHTSVQSLISPYEKKINELEDKLQQTSNANAAIDAAERTRQGIIGEDERYGPANNRYMAARKWVEDVVIDFAQSNGVNRKLTSGEALDYVFDSELKNEFQTKFKDMDLIDVVTAEDSQDHFRRMLRNVSKAITPNDDSTTGPRMDSRFQKVLKKPSSLGNDANAKAGQLSISDKLDNLSYKDLTDLSDSEADTLMKALREEELRDGITFKS